MKKYYLKKEKNPSKLTQVKSDSLLLLVFHVPLHIIHFLPILFYPSLSKRHFALGLDYPFPCVYATQLIRKHAIMSSQELH